jgi:hypothetical protein
MRLPPCSFLVTTGSIELDWTTPITVCSVPAAPDGHATGADDQQGRLDAGAT